nr:hypothetical protein [Tanacetum cinerariifolium]
MAASAIVVSSYSSNESVGSPPSRVILFGNIPTVIPSTSVIALVISSATPVVETTLVTSPSGLCGLVLYSDSNSNSPDEMDSPEYITPLPATSPFFYTDSFEASDSSDGPPSQDPYAIIITRWRSRRVSPRSSDHRPSSSSSPMDSSPVHSSGLDAPDQAHSGSTTRVVSPRLGYPLRFRDSYSSKTSMEEDTEIDTTKTEDGRELDIVDRDDARDHVEIDPRDVKDDTEEYEADTGAGDTVEVGINPMTTPIADEESEEPAGEDSFDSSGTRDGIVRMTERIKSLMLENLKVQAMLSIKRDQIDSLRFHKSRSQEESQQIRDDLRRRLESFVERRLGFCP